MANKPDVGWNPKIGALVNERLAKALKEQDPANYSRKLQTLWDFATGHRVAMQDGKPANGLRIHDGYGSMNVADFKPYHADKWLDADEDFVVVVLFLFPSADEITN